MKNHIYLQARVDSTRFPRKVLKKILNKTIIELIIERLKEIKNIERIILVTGSLEKNKELVDESKRLNLDHFCGNEENVLDRFYKASLEFNSDNIIRITADCPLIDFKLINKGMRFFLANDYDVLSINRVRTFPDGFDFEVFSRDVLETSWKENKSKFDNEDIFYHTFISPTTYMLSDKFRNYDLTNKTNLSHIRLTLDYPQDFDLIKKIYEALYRITPLFSMDDIIKFLNKNSELLEINKKHTNFN